MGGIPVRMPANEQGRTPGPADSVSLEAWRRLYELAAQIRALEPWLWMEETDLFGVEDPDSGDIGFVSVMGLLGEYRAVAVYPGAKTLADFWAMQSTTDQDALADILTGIPHVHAAFGKKSELEPNEKRLVAQLGLAFKGANAWPRFLSFRPGWFPWMADAQEARWLTLALEQLLDVAPRIQKDRRLLGTGGPQHRYLIRVHSAEQAASVWQDTFKACPPPATTVRITIPNASLDAVRALKPSGLTIELDVFPSFTKVGQPGERPQSPYMMLAVEPTSGFILGVELLAVEGALEDLWAQIPGKFLDMITRNQMRPASLALRSTSVLVVMEGLCKDLGVEIKPDPELRALAQARRSLERFSRL